MITGQLFFRHTNEPAPTNDGRQLVIVVGIIAVDENFIEQSEHQYVVASGDNGLTLKVLPQTEKDLTQVARGHTAGGLLTERVWRC